MPSSVQLDEYYSSLYWDSRAGKKYGVHIRDIVHFRILDEFIPEYLVSGKVFLNFGAGHGGISNLIWLKGMEVLNVEPSSLPTFYHERWRTFENITQVPDNSVDILYGSHSLEHVQDIDALKVQVSRILKPGGFMFWEVPNAKSPSNGAQNNSVDIPHTYYFEQKFFEKWFSKTVLCGAYDPCEWVDVIQDWKIYVNDIGPVIRALGQVE
jgi:2-polyprenyl-3-methyl-5-hydroxy-6-metoxy-1,4-benzoquinol methylase